MRVFRLSRKKYGAVLSAKGSFLQGGRWNSPGTAVVYTAQSRALAMAEVAVYLTFENMPRDYMMLEIEVPEHFKIAKISRADLPGDWNVFPHLPAAQRWGDEFVKRGKCLVLQVPSAVVPGDYNYLLNPNHPGYEQVEIGDKREFPFDPRLF